MDTHKNTVYSQMQEMGFLQKDIERAYTKCDIKTVEGLINYIDQNPANENKMEIEDPQNPKKENTPEIPKNKGVEKLVKKELVDKIMVLGYSLLVSQKAVLLSGNKTYEEALKWIQDHKDDKDFEEPIEIAEPPKMSKEEARLKALELGKKIRAETAEAEKKNKMAAEKLRMKMAKEMVDTRRKVKEQQTRLEMESYLREKKKVEDEKTMMLKKLERDKRERFGDKVVVKKEKKKSDRQRFSEIYSKMYNIYRMGQIQLLMRCLKTMRIYLKNIIKNPTEIKFRKINSSNKGFCNRIKDVIGGTNLLEIFGFQLIDGFYLMENVDVNRLTTFDEYLEEKLMGLENIL